jgi:hypothetical protein
MSGTYKFQFLVFYTAISSDLVTLALVLEFGSNGCEDGVLRNGTAYVMLLLILPRSLDCNTLCVNVQRAPKLRTIGIVHNAGLRSKTPSRL